MHKSRLASFIIDCRTPDLDAASNFWSAALNLPVLPAADPLYRNLGTAPDQPHLEVQQVSHESRVHLDIESDDIEAEVRVGRWSHRPACHLARLIQRISRELILREQR